MQSAYGTHITLTRGDTLSMSFPCRIDGEIHELEQGDTVRFALKKDYTDTTPLINKTLNDYELVLLPSDTAQLDFGDYVYDVEITLATGERYTYITKATLTLDKEVY